MKGGEDKDSKRTWDSGGPAPPPSARASYLLAVERARNRLPPRTTSVWPHSANPAELAMGPPAASAHV